MKSINNWPEPDFRSMNEFYGEVGKNMVRLPLPYPLVLAWAPHMKVNRVTCHRKVAESMHRVLSQVHQLYGYDEIVRLGLDQWGGCLNVRKKRGGNSYSIHSWGAANDWLPTENGLSTPWHLARFSEPVYIDFFNAWIAEGWNPLGISWGLDSMHIEATANDVQLLPTNSLLGGMGRITS